MFGTVDVIDGYVSIFNKLVFDKRLEVGRARPSNDMLLFSCIIRSLNFVAAKILIVIFHVA